MLREVKISVRAFGARLLPLLSKILCTRLYYIYTYIYINIKLLHLTIVPVLETISSAKQDAYHRNSQIELKTLCVYKLQMKLNKLAVTTPSL